MSLVNIPVMRKKLGFLVSSLFAAGEQGVWYDPSDISLNWRRNLLTYTEEFDNAAWIKNQATVTANTTSAPNGTTTADSIFETAVTNFHGLNLYFTPTINNIIYTSSFYVKANGRNYCMIFTGSGSVGKYFDITAGTSGAVLGNYGAGPISASITPIGNDWFRCSITYTITSAGLSTTEIYISDNGTRVNYAGDITKGIVVWGAQAEIGSTATAYQRIVTPEISYLDVQPQPILYQDSAGTTPVYAVEQPVGLMLDKSKNLVLGSELVTNTGNPFTVTTGYVARANCTLSTVGGSLVATSLASGAMRFYTSINTTIGKTYKIIANVTAITGSAPAMIAQNNVSADIAIVSTPTIGTYQLIFTATTTTSRIEFGNVSTASAGLTYSISSLSVKEIAGNHAFQATSASRPTLSARYNQLLATATLATQNVTTVAANYKLYFTGTGSVTLSGTATGTYSAGTNTITCTAGTLTITVTGSVLTADLRASNDSLNQPAYQAVVTSSNYDTVGFKPYLRFDGTDDSLATNSIDFTATDKMTVWAGSRKTGTLLGMLVELSTGGAAGSFYLANPYSTSSEFGYVLTGTATGAYTADALGNPQTDVTSLALNIGGTLLSDEIKPRNNGVIPALTVLAAGPAGTGNFGNYPLFIGRRNNASLPFNGRLYQLIVRGAQSTDAEISNGEAYTNIKTGAYS